MSRYADRAKPATQNQKRDIEDMRRALREERISMGELIALQDYAAEGVIDPDDIEILEAAGVSEWEATGRGEGEPQRFAMYVYSIPIVDADVALASAASGSEVDEKDFTRQILEDLIAEEGVQRAPWIVEDGQVTMIEDFIAAMERHA